jgi:hypothetical protein
MGKRRVDRLLLLLLGVERAFFGFRFCNQPSYPFGKLSIKHPLHDLAVARDLLIELDAFVAHLGTCVGAR